MKLTKNANKSKFRGIIFDGKGVLSFAINVVIFGAGKTYRVIVIIKKIKFLQVDKGPTEGINDSIVLMTAEKNLVKQGQNLA